ncbi:riboflavin synthase [Bacillus sp. B1-b2]|uniref:riboflavin synthase n=1 Tax=Bacillus sp. B1-b2 TaxID=2653201 RepID=UPI0012616909|nr:riboflavin synthase [Bacillus sp. B1-b2]KAB7671201.1 riboflavin synthase [Bacillus sp. B1-b2]
MFTGLVEELGTVKKINKHGQTLSLTVQAQLILEDMHIGDSIAVNGVCLTVTSMTKSLFTMDVMPETFHDTTLRELKDGMIVNLERAMHANGRFGGHFVSGHIDCIGSILSQQQKENSTLLEVKIPKEYLHLTMEKGSITIDGTSLTIFNTTDTSIVVSLIPHTAKVSIVGNKIIGDKVNLEFDLLAKFFQAHISRNSDSIEKPTSRVTTSFLKENGFY